MDISTLKSKGAFIAAPPVPTEVEWTHEDENGVEVTDKFTVFVKRMAVGWIDRVFDIGRRNPEGSRTAAIISEAVFFGEDGTEKLTYEQASQLDFGLSRVLVGAFNKVNSESPSKN